MKCNLIAKEVNYNKKVGYNMKVGYDKEVSYKRRLVNVVCES